MSEFVLPDTLMKFAQDQADIQSKNENNLSFWFPKICTMKSMKVLRIPETIIESTPVEVIAALWSDSFNQNHEIMSIIQKHVNGAIMQHLVPGKKYFFKNGTFSNKFYFKSCVGDTDSVLDCFLNINYNSMVVGAGGITEFCIRELIPAPENCFTIYEGMPLQCEFRCFFDVDSKTVYHIVPYWEEDVMRTHLREDLVAFEKALLTLKRNFEEHKSEVVHKVETALQDNFLPKGSRWSVDILLDKNQDYWLIDMAKAENSYYNPEKS